MCLQLISAQYCNCYQLWVNAHVNNLAFSTSYLQYAKKTIHARAHAHRQASLCQTKHSTRPSRCRSCFFGLLLNSTFPIHFFLSFQTQHRNSVFAFYSWLIWIILHSKHWRTPSPKAATSMRAAKPGCFNKWSNKVLQHMHGLKNVNIIQRRFAMQYLQNMFSIKMRLHMENFLKSNLRTWDWTWTTRLRARSVLPLSKNVLSYFFS